MEKNGGRLLDKQNVDGEKKRYKSKNNIGVRIVAGFLAFLMVLSVTATVISYFVV